MQEKRLKAAHQLLDSAVLSRDQWLALMSCVTSDSHEEREAAAEALRMFAPQSWTADLESCPPEWF